MSGPNINTPRYEKELKIAVEAAIQAGSIQRSMAEQAGNDVEVKDDESPVTEVDRRCEAAIRFMTAESFPEDGFLGEESGPCPGKSGRTWIVDPLDGTRPYLRGIPTYSSLIALEDNGEIVLGVMRFEALDETYWASRGGGAFRNGQRLRVSAVAEWGSAMGSALGYVERAGSPQGVKLLELMRGWDYSYGFMDAYSYAAVASGKLDVCVNLLDKPWDCAAACCIVREAGGRFSDVNGNNSVYNGSAVLSNGLLHQEAVERMRG
jgi:histidinol phosphatase-like enzyme (inositol monophosphatase family)